MFLYFIEIYGKKLQNLPDDSIIHTTVAPDVQKPTEGGS